MLNLADSEFEIKAMDRIAQLIIEKYTPTHIQEVEGDIDEIRP